MDWFAQIDAYCERTDFSYWSEPINAITNVAFLIVAILMWPRVKGIRGAQALSVILFAIGVGSYLFHTHATSWAATVDVVPIGLFILTYLFLVNWHMVRWPAWIAFIAMLGFLPYGAGITMILRDIPFFQVSNFYWTVPILLILYAPFMTARIARGFIIGALLLSLSIALRSVDETFCATFPLGTHFLWHILNAIMLGWMIEVYRLHMVEARANQG